MEHIDPLEIRQVRAPLLTDFLQSSEMRNALLEVGNEIKKRYVSKVPKDSGRLGKSVRVKAFRSNEPDNRWMVDVTIGGVMGVDYADDIEAQFGILGSVLREMGYKTGDYVIGPRGKGAQAAPAKVASAFAAKAADERMAELRANPDPQVQQYLKQLDEFTNPRRNLDSAAMKVDYLSLRNSTWRVQAKYGNEASKPGYDAMRNYRGARMMLGLPGHPMERRRDGRGYGFDQEMMDERIGEMGGVTWEMRQAGIQSPYDRGEADPITNYFSEAELNYWKFGGK